MSVTTTIAATAARQQILLLTGPPGVGKTTVIKKICDTLQRHHQISLTGFYTEEVRGHHHGASTGRGQRVGFDVVTLSGKRAPLARVQSEVSLATAVEGKKVPTVGRYVVDVESFKNVALPELDSLLGGASEGVRGQVVMVIDEVGKMELFSRKFVAKVDSLFTSVETQDHTSSSSERHASSLPNLLLLATVPVMRPHQKGHWLVQKLRESRNCQLWQVDDKNRDKLPDQLVTYILKNN